MVLLSVLQSEIKDGAGLLHYRALSLDSGAAYETISACLVVGAGATACYSQMSVLQQSFCTHELMATGKSVVRPSVI